MPQRHTGCSTGRHRQRLNNRYSAAWTGDRGRNDGRAASGTGEQVRSGPSRLWPERIVQQWALRRVIACRGGMTDSLSGHAVAPQCLE